MATFRRRFNLRRGFGCFRLPGQLLAGQADGIVQFPLEHLSRRQLRQILGHPDTGGLQSQQPDVLLRLPGAKDQADGRLFVGVGLVLLEPAEVQFHLPLVGGLEPTELQVDGHQPPQPPVIEQRSR